MTSVYCFSGSGHSYAIAEYFARELQVPVVNIDRLTARQIWPWLYFRFTVKISPLW